MTTSKEHSAKDALPDEELQDLVASANTGGRNPTNRNVQLFIAAVALSWSIFQVWIASPLPYELGFGVFGGRQARPIHLAFALFLAFLVYPGLKSSPRDYIPLRTWIVACIAAATSLYIYFFDQTYLNWVYGTRLSDRLANPNVGDMAVAVVGILLLLEATRRSLGPPLAIVAVVFLGYTFLGPHAPGILAWKGASFSAVADHQWLSGWGVFGISLGVSADLVFLFVLFGALLERAGAGNYFIKVAFSLMGHLRGGPAKAAVVASGMTGLISGSSIANVVTTGTFTIPMMKRVGFRSEKAGAVEVASSVNGQIMPPVMGAAAFLMVEYVNIPYFQVVKHAFLPAAISYIALVYIVHLEAVKNNMPMLERAGSRRPMKWVALSFAISVSGFLAIAGGLTYLADIAGALASNGLAVASLLVILAVIIAANVVARRVTNENKRLFLSTGALVLGYAVFIPFLIMFAVDLMRELTGNSKPLMVIITGLALLVTYILLVKRCSAFPELELDDPESREILLPEPGPVLNSGLHFLLPVALLIWCLMVERLSPSLSAFYAVVAMMFVLITQRPLFAFFRGQSSGRAWQQGFRDLIDGMITGARNMIGIGVATATAGIIVGAVSQTGVGGALSDIVEVLAGNQMMLILIFTALLSLILGMGLPTTANYIVVSSLLAPVIVTLGQQNGLVVPAIAVHLFVFYFGIMADVTPPVGLASFAAAAVSGGDPIRTGIVAFFYSLRTALLPFLFIFNTQLLLIDVGYVEAIFVFIIATIAMLVFTAATQGYFQSKSKIWETVLLLLIAFTLFRPGFWMDMASPPFKDVPPTEIVRIVEMAPSGSVVRATVDGFDEKGDPITLTMDIDVGEGSTGPQRLESFGLEILEKDGKMIVDNVGFESVAQDRGFDLDQTFKRVQAPLAQPPKQLFYIPALLLLLAIAFVQRRRQAKADHDLQTA